MVVGFVGSGNMVAAMAHGWAAGDSGPSKMLFTDSGSGRAAALAGQVGGTAIETNAELVSQSDLVVLGFKPGDLEAIAPSIQGADVVASLLGGTSVERISEAFPDSEPIRLMPNLGVLKRRGVICFTAGPGVSPDVAQRTRSLLDQLGHVVEIADQDVDAATAVMGCTPAYLALVAEAIAEAGADAGLHVDVALSIFLDTMSVTADLLRDQSPRELREAVASPGGSTEAGLEALAREGGAEAFTEAINASLRRMRGQDA